MALTWDQAMAQYNPTSTPLTIAGTSSGTDSGLSIDGGGGYVDFPTSGTTTNTTNTTNTVKTDPYASYGGATTYNNNVSQYDQGINQINSALGNLGPQKQSTDSKIQASYDDALSQLLLGENQAHSTYDTNVLQNKQDYVAGKNTVRSNAGNSLNSLLRLLGSRGAGGSSAATITAPGAVARSATLQQSDLGNNFGHNAQSLDTNWGNYELGVNNQRASARKQLDEQAAANNDQFNTQQASLLQQLAQLSGQKAAYTGGNATAAAQPYLDQANALSSQVGRFNYTPIDYKTQAYTAPTLDKYTVNPNATPTYNGQSAGNDYFSPYLQALLGKKQQLAGA